MTIQLATVFDQSSGFYVEALEALRLISDDVEEYSLVSLAGPNDRLQLIANPKSWGVLALLAVVSLTHSYGQGFATRLGELHAEAANKAAIGAAPDAFKKLVDAINAARAQARTVLLGWPTKETMKDQMRPSGFELPGSEEPGAPENAPLTPQEVADYFGVAADLAPHVEAFASSSDPPLEIEVVIAPDRSYADIYAYRPGQTAHTRVPITPRTRD